MFEKIRVAVWSSKRAEPLLKFCSSLRPRPLKSELGDGLDSEPKRDFSQTDISDDGAHWLLTVGAEGDGKPK